MNPEYLDSFDSLFETSLKDWALTRIKSILERIKTMGCKGKKKGSKKR